MRRYTVKHSFCIIMECIKNKISPEPVAGVHNIHDTVSTGGRYSLYLLVALQVVVVLILIILLGINAAAITQSDGRASTSHQQSANQMEQLNNITGILQMLQDTLSNQLLTIIMNEAKVSSNIYNLMRNNDAKVDFQKSTNTRILNLTSSIDNSLQKTTLKLSGIANTLTELQSIGTSTAGVVDDILPVVEKLLNLQNASSIINSIRPVSCKDIKVALPNSPTGYYHVNSRDIYCNMDTLCNVTGEWTRIGYLDMTQSAYSCPSSLTLYEEDGYRLCRRSNNTPSCNSIILQNNGISYSQICGKVTAYQYRAPDAIANRAQENNLNSYYLDGISITRGSPRQHVWSLIVGLFENSVPGYESNCPCATGSRQTVQSFIGNNYFCESGNPSRTLARKIYSNDVLWDGENCGSNEMSCCSAPGLPWFHRDYGTNTTTDYIELRLCGDEGRTDEDAMLSEYEIYIK